MDVQSVASFPGKSWSFVSNHLPIGLRTYCNYNNVVTVTWNILHSQHIHNLALQGWNGSKITNLNTKTSESDKLTQRERAIVDLVFTLFNHVADIVCLQDVQGNIINELTEKVVTKYHIGLLSTDDRYSSKGAILYSRDSLELMCSDVKHGIYSENPDSYIQNAIFELKETNHGFMSYQVINTHIPEGPSGKKQFSDYITEKVNGHASVTILAGDMNHTEKEIDQAIKESCPQRTFFTVPYNNKTHLNKNLKAIKFDHIFASAQYSSISLKPLEPQNLFTSTSEAAELLKIQLMQ